VSRKALIIDCDPGVDDAVALFLAFASPEDLEILAVTTAAGNVDATLTARNARLIRQLAGREDVPVHAGAAVPLVREPIAAAHFHGESGLGTLPVFEPAAPVAPGHAAQAIVALVMSRPAGSVSMAVTGPMTNLALALRLEPALAGRLGTVVVMGGARREGGNITASAEYNIYADPHAADVVFRSGVSCVVLGLDATHQLRATPERLARIAAIDTVAAQSVATLIGFSSDIERRLPADARSQHHRLAAGAAAVHRRPGRPAGRDDLGPDRRPYGGGVPPRRRRGLGGVDPLGDAGRPRGGL
jgi:purine nucleosidase